MGANDNRKKLRIVWVDDNEDEYLRVRAPLEEDSNGECTIEYEPLERLIDDERPGIEELLLNPPDVLLMDWNEGYIAEYYPLIKDCGIGSILLISGNNSAELHLQRAFIDYPELEHRTLTKPFTFEKLSSLLAQQPKIANDRYLTDILPLRYLDNAFLIIGKTNGWKLSDNLIPVDFSETERISIKDSHSVYRTVYSADPSGSGEFGPILIITSLLPDDVARDKGNIPKSAQYMQRAIALPPMGVPLEQIGNSAQGIIDLMLKSGRFKRGRFYSLNFISGLAHPALELFITVPGNAGTELLPISREIDDDEQEDYRRFCEEYIKFIAGNKKDQLIYEIRGIKDPNPFWGKYISNEGVLNRLRIPVFRTKAEIQEIVTKGQLRGDLFDPTLLPLAGIFIFDKGIGKDVTIEDVNAIKQTFLSMLTYFSKTRAAEAQQHEQELGNYLLQFHKELNKSNTSDLIEQALTTSAIRALIEFDSAKETEIEFSATYARYNPRNFTVDVTFETGNLGENNIMAGLKFPLTNNTFVIQKCANAVLKCGKEILFHIPRLSNFINLEESLRREREFQQLAPERLEQWIARINKMKALIAIPVLTNPRTSSAKLLGVLLVRANKEYVFNQRRTELLRGLVSIALPHIENFEAMQNHIRELETAILHEARSHISLAMAKLDILQNNHIKVMRESTLNDLALILREQIETSTAIMHWFGRNEVIQNNGPTDEKFWERISDYGTFCSNSRDDLKWKFAYDSTLYAQKAFYFERVMKIVIDNAFRHSDPNSGIITCFVTENTKQAWLKVEVTNPGILNWNQVELSHLPTRCVPIDQIKMFEKAIGMNLLKFLCEQVNAPIPYFQQNSANKVQPGQTVTLVLHWPLANLEVKSS
jgi:hypothetical protein